MPSLRLLVLGASGGCGRWLTRLAAASGHTVSAVVREGSSVEPLPNVTVRVGDVTDRGFLERVVPGHDAVLSCLGIRRAGKVPWARVLSPADFTERAARVLVPAMESSGVRRLVAISAGGVRDSAAQLTPVVRTILGMGNVALQYRDLANMERIVEATALDWLIVRPVTLVDGAPRGLARPVAHYGMFSHARRSEVAEWMLHAAEETGPFRERHVMLASLSAAPRRQRPESAAVPAADRR
ncbi:MAG TPA: NAD(P)H-binding protein [Gemmatimonadaceae bacterium]|nr:NAD(P)H-binding protein [Gemmatimonadaceae bacterium]